MLMGKFLGIAAALLLAAGCLAPMNGYYGNYGGYGGYGDYAGYGGYYDNGYTGYYNPSYGSGYSYPAPSYGYSYGYPGCNSTTVYRSNTVVYPQSSAYQSPVYYPGNSGSVAPNPPSSHWRRRQAQNENYQRGRHNQYYQDGSSNFPAQRSVGPGAQTQPPLFRQGHRQQQSVSAPAMHSGPYRQRPRSQAMQASSPGPVMNRPAAQTNMRPAMAAPRPMTGGNSGGSPRATQSQERQSRQKRGGSGSQ